MSLFAMVAKDVPNGQTLRKQYRQEHVDHVRALHDAGRIVLAGPLKDDEHKNSIGAIIVFEAESVEEARHWVNADPYVVGGVFSSVSVNSFRQVFPKPK